MWLAEMEADDYAEMINDEEYQKELIRFFRHMKNVNVRVFGSVLSVPPK